MLTLNQAPSSLEFPAFGGTAVVGAADPDASPRAVAHARARIAGVDREPSRFRSDSELARIEHRSNMSHIVSPLFIEALDLACRAATATDGWFDPTVRDAVEAAGYDRSIEQLERDGPGAARVHAPAGQWRRSMNDRASRLEVRLAGDWPASEGERTP